MTDCTELIFEVTQDDDGGYCAACLTESICTQGDTWEELRLMVKDAVEGYFFDGLKPERVRLRFTREEVLFLQ